MRMQRDGKRRTARRPRWSRTLETLERRELLAGDTSLVAPLHNSLNSRDVNHDNRVTPIDALLVINHLMSTGTQIATNSGASPQTSTTGADSTTKPAYLDVNGDNIVSPIDALYVINLLAVEKLVQISVTPTNLAGTVITEIPVGSDFLLQAVVQDVRSPVSTTPGVFSAYLNASYDSGLATISPSAVLNFDPFFPVAQTFDVTTPGLVSSAGATGGSLTPPGNSAQKLWTVLVHASAGGAVTFTPSFDTAAGHDVTLYGDNDVITSDMIDFVGSTLTITQNPTINTAAVSAAEGNAGTTPFVFTVTLSNTSNQNVTVQYNTVAAGGGNAATAGVDYTAVSGTLTFTPGQTMQFVTVPVIGDLSIEPDEVFNFVLSNPTNGVLGANAVVTGTILNDDSQSTLAIGDLTVINVTSGTFNAIFTVTLTPGATSDVTVLYATANNTAIAGVDYTATSGTLTFSPGATAGFITVPIIGDPLPDATESFFVNLTSPSGNAVLLDGQAVGTIQPAVPIPNLTVNNVIDTEGNSGTKPYVFTATLSSPASEQIRVAYATADGTATVADNDYVAQSGTLTFAPGASQATVTISVLGDMTLEPTETFSLNLSPISGTLGTVQTQAIGTIQNDDGPPTITIDDATVVGGSSGQIDAVFTVTLSVAANSPVTVSYATADNSAQANEDYLAQSGILTFVPGGPLSQFITVPVLGTPLPGPDETFFVNLSSASSWRRDRRRPGRRDDRAAGTHRQPRDGRGG